MAKKEEVITQFDDWSVWEALRMSRLKGHEFTVYNAFTRRTATAPLSAKPLEIIDLVSRKHLGGGLTDLSQTQVRYAMKKLINKGLILSSKSIGMGSSSRLYTSRIDAKMFYVVRLQKQESDAREKHGDLDSMKATVTARVMKMEKKLRKIKRLIAAAEYHQEIAQFDMDPRSIIDIEV